MIFDPSYALAGALTGFVVGLTGVGGGALMTPILLLVFGVSPPTAVATDLWFAALTKLVGARIHCRAGSVDWQVAKRLWTGSLPVALAVVALLGFGIRFARQDWLSHAIGVAVILTALGLFLAPMLQRRARTRRLAHPASFLRWQPAMTILAGAVIGLCVALTSVGAGALGSVALLYLYPLRMTPHRLVATDIVHAIPLAMVAGLGYLLSGLVDAGMLFSMLAGSIPAITAGSLLAHRVSARKLQIALAIVLVVAGCKAVI
ncbi:sulfite exporter TauE/SafE family protein [Niveibacterium umoris]|uniref:Probable membrane transporter protein n=1 Tax=Niveibacterium umoris TaxID=1193620 RepID=A0A840BFB1_9RHOO|nr:sulfite exporter TauE/SafE family protein [Niveibacterium umoris]MBB4012221.1 hypothetical protein [Niveibacterium umoris]